MDEHEHRQKAIDTARVSEKEGGGKGGSVFQAAKQLLCMPR